MIFFILTGAFFFCVASDAEASQRVFRSGVDIVSIAATVIDKDGNFVTDLNANDFEIVEEGGEQRISYFAGGEMDRASLPPLHIGLLFDTSGSMQADLKLSQRGAVRFLNALTDAVDITFVDFDTEVRVGRYGQADLPRLVERIRLRKSDGWTALYDALGVYLDGASGQQGRKILIIYSDGGDTRSSLTRHEIFDLLRASDVTVYTIGFLEHQPRSVKTMLRSDLSRIAKITGGHALFPRSLDDLDEMYDRVSEEIGAQYNLGFIPSEQISDGSWRKLKIKLTGQNHKKYEVRARQGYFAPYFPPTAENEDVEPRLGP